MFKKNKKTKNQKVFDAKKGGFTDLFSNVSEKKDILKNSNYTKVFRLNDEVCENIFTSSWVGKRIVELPVQRALKNGLIFECENKQTENEVWRLYHELGIENMIIDAQVSADIYGSSVMILKDKSQNPLEKALKYKNLKPILTEYPFYSVMPKNASPYEAGTITATNPTLTVNESHCAIFTGAKVPTRIAPQYKFFGMSIYQSLWSALINDASIMTAVANITYRSSIRHYKLKGLKELVMSNRQDLALERMGVLDASADIFGSVVMDSEDEMQIVSQSIAGLADIDKRSGERLAAASGIPATLLLGKSPDGQNSTGEGDDDNFIIFIENYQKKMMPALNRIFAALNSLANGDNNWKIKFKTPDAVDFNKKPEFDGKILANAMMMINELQLPQEVVERYMLENNIITQDEKKLIKQQTLEFDEIDAPENNEI